MIKIFKEERIFSHYNRSISAILPIWEHKRSSSSMNELGEIELEDAPFKRYGGECDHERQTLY